MICDAIIPKQSASWVEDRPFLLWEIGPRRILDHWMDTLFRSNATLRLWMEIPDERLMAFVRETFPLNLRIQAGAGPPTSRPEACTFLDSKGSIIIRRGPQLTPYLPKQPASHTWFAMVRKWLAELQETGSQTPEVERPPSVDLCVLCGENPLGHSSRSPVSMSSGAWMWPLVLGAVRTRQKQ